MGQRLQPRRELNQQDGWENCPLQDDNSHVLLSVIHSERLIAAIYQTTLSKWTAEPYPTKIEFVAWSAERLWLLFNTW
jgi:hypothetical protein